MSVKLGRRVSDVDVAEWADVLRRARVAVLRKVTGGSILDDTMVEVRFDDEVEERLRELLGEIVLRSDSIAHVVQQLKDAFPSRFPTK